MIGSGRTQITKQIKVLQKTKELKQKTRQGRIFFSDRQQVITITVLSVADVNLCFRIDGEEPNTFQQGIISATDRMIFSLFIFLDLLYATTI